MDALRTSNRNGFLTKNMNILMMLLYNQSGRAYKQGTQTVKGLTNKVLEHSPG